MVCRLLRKPQQISLREDMEKAKDYAQVITDQVDRVTRMMERILGFARSDPVAELAAVPGSDSFVADQEFDRRDVSKPLRVLMDDVQGLVAEHFRKARIKIEIVLPKESLIVESAGAVEQVLVNLLLNAAQALDPSINDRSAETGQSWAELESRRVFLRLLNSSDPSFQSAGPCGLEWIFVVEDSGPGVPFENRECIFDPLFTKGPHRGTGLGLAIASKIANDLGGRLVLAEQPCARATLTGARFEFWLGDGVVRDESLRVERQSPIQ
jgi:signal transduction histidine kinase